MREAFGTNGNIMHVVDEDDGTAMPVIEFIVYCRDKELQHVGDDMQNVCTLETIKFAIQPKIARKFAKVLCEFADKAEDQANKLNAMVVQTESE